MGLIASRLRRKKTIDILEQRKKTIDILEQLETDINSIQRERESKKQNHKRAVRCVKAFTVGLYILSFVLFCYIYVGSNQNWINSLVYVSPVIILACLLTCIRSNISKYYDWSLIKDKIELKRMKEEKKRLLEDVMECETYKVAKPILDKYGIPEENKKTMSYTPAVDAYGDGSSSREDFELTNVGVK